MGNTSRTRRTTMVTAAMTTLIVGLSIWAAVRRTRPVDTVNPPATEPPAPSAMAAGLPRSYSPAGVIGGDHLFRERAVGVAVGADNRLYAAGDRRVVVFDHCAARVGGWDLPEAPTAIAVDAGGNVYVGHTGRVDKYTAEGESAGVIGDGVLGRVTGLAADANGVLVADADAGVVRVFDAGGVHIGDIVPDTPPTKRFRLPNNSLDVALDAAGRVLVTHSGPHTIETYDRHGARIASFGGYGATDRALFPGCCNPISLAIAGDGVVVAAQKAPACVKVFDADGSLLAVIDPSHFSPENTQMDVAVDAGGRIYVADTAGGRVRLFRPTP